MFLRSMPPSTNRRGGTAYAAKPGSFGRVCAGALLLCTALAPLAHSAPPKGYGLVWSDEFKGTALDTNKWDYWLGGPRWLAVNTPRAVAVSNGALTIATYTIRGTNLTGMISTRGLFEPKYGYVEARVAFRNTSGAWSSFLFSSPTLGNWIGNPATSGTEVDIFEHRARDFYGNDVSGEVQHAMHWDGYGAAHKTVAHLTGPMGLESGYHLYGYLWTPQRCVFYVDGKETWRRTAPIATRSEFLVLCSEVVNGWAGAIPARGYGPPQAETTYTKVDYVRYYQQPPSTTIAPTNTVAPNAVTSAIPFRVRDAEIAPWRVQVTATSTTPGLVPSSNLTVVGATNPWTCTDIGPVGLRSQSDICGEGITVVGCGAGVRGKADDVCFLRQPLSGDGTVSARVQRMENSRTLAQAGVMIRESTAAGARCAYVAITPEGKTLWRYRRSPGRGIAEEIGSSQTVAPYWVRLTRKGNMFTAYCARDNAGSPGKWVQVGSPQTILMAARAQAGLAVASGDPALWCNVLFAAVSGSLKTGEERRLVVSPTLGRSGTARIALVADDGYLRKTSRVALVIAPISTLSAPPGAPPQLQAAALDGRTTLRWPDATEPFVLQSATSLVPKATWVDVTNPVLATNGEHTVTLPTTSASTYFRLFRPPESP